MKNIFFVSGIGTGVGKTLVSAILTEALQADYWKPVQAGLLPETDSEWVGRHISNTQTRIWPELHQLQLPASPHLAARKEGVAITVKNICNNIPDYNRNLIVEGAGGFLVPLNEQEFMRDLVLALGAKLILVSRAYLGSINHSLMTAEVCKHAGIPVAGWVFNGYDLTYEKEITAWSGIPMLASIQETNQPGKSFVKATADALRESLTTMLC